MKCKISYYASSGVSRRNTVWGDRKSMDAPFKSSQAAPGGELMRASHH